MKTSKMLLVKTIAITLLKNLEIAVGALIMLRIILPCSIPHVWQIQQEMKEMTQLIHLTVVTVASTKMK